MTMMAPNKTTEHIHITDNAAQRIKFLREQEQQPHLMLRILVEGGGCSGFQYKFTLEEQCQEDDVIFEHLGTHVVMDSCSLSLLKGIEIDFVENMTRSCFVVHNPQAVSKCSCGASFSL